MKRSCIYNYNGIVYKVNTMKRSCIYNYNGIVYKVNTND
jgi:hypothetical protein